MSRFDSMKYISYSFVGAVMYLSLVSTAYSEPMLPLVGEQSISVDEKICIYGSAGRIAAIRMLSDDECLSRFVNRPGKSGRVMIETEQIFGDTAKGNSDLENSDGLFKTGKPSFLH
ncbi:hypothetical protein ACCY16_17580 [Candidatus Pantoea formicae]|uniref:hypothetical protein n=1 Tax=Candidatus Pantoea formicae TaxID=2608355 RepID=UPI003ED83F5F